MERVLTLSSMHYVCRHKSFYVTAVSNTTSMMWRAILWSGCFYWKNNTLLCKVPHSILVLKGGQACLCKQWHLLSVSLPILLAHTASAISVLPTAFSVWCQVWRQFTNALLYTVAPAVLGSRNLSVMSNNTYQQRPCGSIISLGGVGLNRARNVCFSVWLSPQALIYVVRECRTGHIWSHCWCAPGLWCTLHGHVLPLPIYPLYFTVLCTVHRQSGILEPSYVRLLGFLWICSQGHYCRLLGDHSSCCRCLKYGLSCGISQASEYC